MSQHLKHHTHVCIVKETNSLISSQRNTEPQTAVTEHTTSKYLRYRLVAPQLSSLAVGWCKKGGNMGKTKQSGGLPVSMILAY